MLLKIASVEAAEVSGKEPQEIRARSALWQQHNLISQIVPVHQFLPCERVIHWKGHDETFAPYG